MGQALFKKELIGVLSSGGATISIGASYIILGGQGFSIPSAILSIGTPTANTLYFLYFSWNGTTVSFVQSLNPNSVGPAGAVAWKLVGAYYPTPSSVFGSFVNITGVPFSDEIVCGVNVWSIAGGAVTKGTTSVDICSYRREGSYYNFTSHYQQAAGSSSGAAAVQLLLPGLVSADTNIYDFDTRATGDAQAGAEIIGKCDGYYSTNINNQPILYDANHLAFKTVLALATNGFWTGTVFGFGNAFGLSTLVRIRNANWSNTQLVDL